MKRHRPLHRPAARWLIALLTLAAAAAHAQYKIVGPDGSVTYTDRAPAEVAGKIVELGRRSAAAESDTPALPAELQRIALRHPVTLFSGERCPPCDRGRELLQRRGVPYRERSVVGAADIDALQARTGARTLPALAIGGHVLRGWSETEWQAYLDAAGYPATSRLPPGWSAPPVQPLVPREPAAQAAVPPARVAAPAASSSPALPPAPASGGIRF
jgi:glutaredoxin